MVNNQCYVCNNTVTFESNSEIRDKYYNIIGNKLYPGSHLCYICTHMTHKLWSFRNTCVNRGVDVQYGCEEELNWSLLFRLTKDGEKPHNLEISNVHLTIICPEIKCQAKESVPINLESLDHDIIQDLCINEDILPAHNMHDNYFNDFDNYVHDTQYHDNQYHDDRIHSIDSTFYGLNKEDYFLEVNNIQKVDFVNNDCNYVNSNVNNDSFDNSNDDFEDNNDTREEINDSDDFRECSNDIQNVTVPNEFLLQNSETEKNPHDKTINPIEKTNNPLDKTNNPHDDTNNSHDEINSTLNKINNPQDKTNNPHDETNNSHDETDKELQIKQETHFLTKITLSLKEQKDILEGLRREKKYIEAEFKCHSCALSFLFKDSYQSHMVRHEESNGQYSCSLCGLRFATANARRMHTPLHSERYVCSLCNDVILPVRRKKHMVECWKVKNDPVTCHLCGKMFQDSSGLQQHLKRFHQSKEKKRNYTCNTCGKTYNDQGALRTHLIKHTNRRYECQQCPSSFSSPYTLQMHKKCHYSNLQQYCTDCDRWYKTRKHLMQHFKNSPKHQQVSFECPICNRTCPTRQALDIHIQASHSTDKPYTCPTCPARYSTKNSLVRHCKIHQQYIEAKEFVCHLCGKSYRGKSKLTRHLREVCERPKIEEFATMLT